MTPEVFCSEHSGCLKEFENLKVTDKRMQRQMDALEARVDDIMSRLNHILGGIVIASILLLIDILTRIPAMLKI
jgi:hypothetical protein